MFAKSRNTIINGRILVAILTMVISVWFLPGIHAASVKDSGQMHISSTNQSANFQDSSIKAKAVAPQSPSVSQSVKQKAEETGHIGKKIQNTFSRFTPFYIFIFLGGFIIIAIIRIIDPPYLTNLFASTINLKLLISLFNEGIFGFNVTNLLLDLLCISMLSIGIQIYFFPLEPQYFIWILAFASTGYFLKLIVIQFLANIFMGHDEALAHLLMHLLFTRLLALVLLPVLFISLYQTALDVESLLHFIFIALALMYGGWLSRLFIQMKSISTSGVFYLFLYLCTVELSPLAILLKDYIR